MADVPDVLAEVGPRLRRLREARDLTLTEVAAKTGSPRAACRAWKAQRRPSLELLLPLAEVYHLALDELVGAPRVGDPRIRTRPRARNERLVYPLTQQSSGMAVWKVVIHPERERRLRSHTGYEWLYVLSGEMRLILGEHDVTLQAGEVAEFDTGQPHWFGPTGDAPVEILSIHATQGQRMTSARPAGAAQPLQPVEQHVEPEQELGLVVVADLGDVAAADLDEVRIVGQRVRVLGHLASIGGYAPTARSSMTRTG